MSVQVETVVTAVWGMGGDRIVVGWNVGVAEMETSVDRRDHNLVKKCVVLFSPMVFANLVTGAATIMP
jgi:hypothetical protein